MKKAALVLNGEHYIRNFKEDYIVCADNGYAMCLAKGVVPDAIVGDMDSIEDIIETIPDSVKIERYSADKNETDGELALKYLIHQGYDRINIYGADGGRLDHVVGNVSLMYQAFQLGVRAVIKTNRCDMYFVNSFFEHHTQIGDLISIVPYSNEVHILSTEGLKYPIVDKRISKGATLGISNVATAESVSVHVIGGEALVFRIFK